MLIQIRIKIATCLCNCPLTFAMHYQRHCRFCQIIDFEELGLVVLKSQVASSYRHTKQHTHIN